VTDRQLVAEYQHGQIDAVQEIREIVRSLGQDCVAVLQLIIDRMQFFVGALQFLLRGLEFFVGALQFLIGGLDLLVRRQQFLILGVALF
jgi:hypothetical protein